MAGDSRARSRQPVGQVVAFSNYCSGLLPLIMLGNMVAQVAAAEASAHRILGVLDTANDVQESEQATARPLGGRVVFDHVTFSYDGANAEPVLKDVNLVAEPGESVAILGATGAGKSSLVGLIPRFYDVTEGRILLDGTDVRDLALASLRTQVGVALQEAVLFSGTVRDNYLTAGPSPPRDEECPAAKAAQIDILYHEPAAGYDTLIGSAGVNLSARQKAALALPERSCVPTYILSPRRQHQAQSTSRRSVGAQAPW